MGVIFCPASLTRVRHIEAAGHWAAHFQILRLFSGPTRGLDARRDAARRPRGGARRSRGAANKEDIATGPAARRPAADADRGAGREDGRPGELRAGDPQRQLLALTKNPPEGISVGLADDDDMYTWEVMIIGPDGTLYEGGM